LLTMRLIIFFASLLFATSRAQTVQSCDCLSLKDTQKADGTKLVAEDFKLEDCKTLEDGTTECKYPRQLFEGDYGGYCDAWETRRGEAGAPDGMAGVAPYINPPSPYTECQIPAFECHANLTDITIDADACENVSDFPPGAKVGATWQDADNGKCKIEFESNTENLCVYESAEFKRNFCGDENWCVLRWCYVSAECAEKQTTTFWAASTFTNEANHVQIYYSYEACGTPDCYTHTTNDALEAPMGCPYDPLGEFGCDSRTDLVFRTEENVNDGCPKGSGNSELSLDFTKAEVISRNLNGQFCDPTRWNADGSSIEPVGRNGPVSSGTLPRVEVGGKLIPKDCYRDTTSYCDLREGDPTDSSCPTSRCEVIKTNGDTAVTACVPTNVTAASYETNSEEPIPDQILICEQDDGDLNTPRKCLRIVDTSGNYRCQTTLKCGDIIRDDEEELCSVNCQSVLGQIQIDQTGQPADEKTINLEFTVMVCPTPDVNDCMPLYWDNMIMTFLDIDGDQERMEELVFHDIWDYHLVPIENILENADQSGRESDNLEDHVYGECSCDVNTDCSDNTQTPPGAVKYITSTDPYECTYASPMTLLRYGVQNSDNVEWGRRQKTPRDQWAYDVDGAYTYQPPATYLLYEYTPPGSKPIEEWHAIWPMEDTYGNPQDAFEDTEVKFGMSLSPPMSEEEFPRYKSWIIAALSEHFSIDAEYIDVQLLPNLLVEATVHTDDGAAVTDAVGSGNFASSMSSLISAKTGSTFAVTGVEGLTSTSLADEWDLDIVDNSKFRTQRGIMFPNMMIEISDPEHVYRWLKVDENQRTNNDEYAWIDPRQTGDVFVRNKYYTGNGNELNPTDLTELTWGQATRAISPEWVSERFLNQRYNNIANGAKRSSFNVSMGTAKRTILFAGQAEALFSECKTCQTWYDNGGQCPNNGAHHVNKVCFIDGHSSIRDIELCSEHHCCKDVPTSHGDPIIWTFFEECYDLNKDGIYSASKHPDYDHEVKIAVYNNYMREIQVVDTESGEILLSINTMGHATMNKFKYYFSEETQECPSDMKNTECDGKFKLWEFDAQSFRYAVHLLRHDYLDDGLPEGELGYHLDIYPKPYNSFESMKNEYTGLYFENPLPDELEYCPGGSEHW